MAEHGGSGTTTTRGFKSPNVLRLKRGQTADGGPQHQDCNLHVAKHGVNGTTTTRGFKSPNVLRLKQGQTADGGPQHEDNSHQVAKHGGSGTTTRGSKSPNVHHVTKCLPCHQMFTM
jgi:hypothetical protein